MILSGIIVILVLAAIWLAAAALVSYRLGLGFRQAMLYAPLRALYRIDDRDMAQARAADAPVIYAVSHQSQLDPALMLAILPDDTLHILDERSARSIWLDPWRELARTIAFNTGHVFVSRRLVRHLKGKGRLAVYFPDETEPDAKSFRLYRAVARIATKAEARVVPIFVGGSRYTPFSLTPPHRAPRRLLPRLVIKALEPMTISELLIRGGAKRATNSNAFFDRIAEARHAASDPGRSLFRAMRDAADCHGHGRVVVEDILGGKLTYRQLFATAHVLAWRFAAESEPGEAIGLMLPNAAPVVGSFLALQSAGRVAAMINYTAGRANISSALRTAAIRTVVSSRAFVEKAQLSDIVTAIENEGRRIIWLEDIEKQITFREKLSAFVGWRRPVHKPAPDDPAVILFTSGSEGEPKGVVLSHRNLIANVAQVETRIAFSPADKLFNVLPVFHSFGLTGGTILPLLHGVRLYLYPSPLHYKLIPETAAKVRPTVMFGTDTFLANYAETAKDDDFASIRLVVAGAEPVRTETRKIWRERFGAEIVEGFGMTEASPVIAVNSATHSREGSVGRLLPGISIRLEEVDGLQDGGRLWISGPNVMLGYMTSDRPGELQPLASDWHDTGDIVSIDREGFMTIRGRARRFAKIAGEMVSLGAIEMLASALWPEEKHAVVSVPDRKRGERIVLVTTAETADRSALRQFGKKSGTAEIMVPNDVLKVSEIPVLGSGKTDYAGVRRIAMESLGLEEAA
ncbi:acyl-[acyl-carrier-protein]-phospholipid O-acyltransferase/long-chain-fatty-acid--[acyl-carrier-protein] ligase [Mesorhizobium sp. J18]|uniref:AMP-binding protein n=1 Tax=Mesorhizobium sp. J18 TaxID=935263 RepID=UPI00119AADD2|nr:AMP-binding protein [Mesorhizobium sp. J18]TWG90924.1 acyl-[acyl-carrier-protein]-phospholipid O-acyltransferase/long-chain-fatty-acid--[acyl-carrier-protein] ligase [Mesorhizobium sp. J18]